MPDASDYFEIQNLLHLYSEAVDLGDFDRVGELFQHAAIYFPGDDEPSVPAGSGAFGEQLARWTRRFPEAGGTPRTRHLCTNLIIEFDDDEHARTRSYFVVFQGTERVPLQPIITGGYHDRLEKRDGAWCFVERRELVGQTGDLSDHLLQSYEGPTGE